ncbi:MarR family transcriptional regulator [Agrococcus sp. SL85]|uniref:MarR family winged helix-turn-helix transcriptional regulator n=1 Tax=Agrococcus sp. SL85 TaxID=2995141 RepID=UPI00226D3124|nr:MarR family transcriptional regulator [Agrococcus sp. SL85]WAC65821.1 MarR family transcriptional regulator [Agrococcus sp. SL85]
MTETSDAAAPAPDADRHAAVQAVEDELSSLIGSVRRVLAEHAERVSPGMLPGVYKVLTTIARHEGITLSALAESLMADKGQMSRAVRELEGLGLVERAADPRDRRSSALRATAVGQERLAAARAPRERALVAALEDWALEDVQALARLLRALATGTTPGA